MRKLNDYNICIRKNTIAQHKNEFKIASTKYQWKVAHMVAPRLKGKKENTNEFLHTKPTEDQQMLLMSTET